jgi:hypothetical protein
MIAMPAELTTFVDVEATPEHVWQVLTDLPAYPEWNPFITEAEGAFVVGERLSVRAPTVNSFVPAKLRPTVVEVVPFRRLRLWSRLDRLAIPGIFHAELTWTLSDHDGGVRLWQQDRFGGLLTPLLFRSLNRHSLQAFNEMNAALKHRVEGTPVPGPVEEERS